MGTDYQLSTPLNSKFRLSKTEVFKTVTNEDVKRQMGYFLLLSGRLYVCMSYRIG